MLDYNFGYVSLRTVVGVTTLYEITYLGTFAPAFTIGEHLHVHFGNVFSMAIGVAGGVRVPIAPVLATRVPAPVVIGSLSPMVLTFGDLGRHQVELRGGLGWKPFFGAVELLVFLGYTFLF